MQAVFYGVGAAVIGIITVSSYKLTRRTIGNDWLLWLIYLVSLVCTVVTESEIVWLFLGAGLLAWIIKARPKRLDKLAAIALPLGFKRVVVHDNANAWPILVNLLDLRCILGAAHSSVALLVMPDIGFGDAIEDQVVLAFMPHSFPAVEKFGYQSLVPHH